MSLLSSALIDHLLSFFFDGFYNLFCYTDNNGNKSVCEELQQTQLYMSRISIIWAASRENGRLDITVHGVPTFR